MNRQLQYEKHEDYMKKKLDLGLHEEKTARP